jgi:hypothetical protein
LEQWTIGMTGPPMDPVAAPWIYGLNSKVLEGGVNRAHRKQAP